MIMTTVVMATLCLRLWFDRVFCWHSMIMCAMIVLRGRLLVLFLRRGLRYFFRGIGLMLVALVLCLAIY